MSRNILLSAFYSIFVIGCSNLQSDLISMPDSSLVSADMGLGVCQLLTPENTEGISCVTCPGWCLTSDTDMCDTTNKRCVCGLEGRPCGSGEECRNGICLAVDPEGSGCEFDPECAVGRVCLESRCSPAGCRPEMCNGYDDDCDGEVDNLGPAPLSRWCLAQDLPIESTRGIVPPCRAGSQVCSYGVWQECIGSIGPANEIGTYACDGIDNNCDGCIDGTVTSGTCVSQEPVGFDVVFAIDISGSMNRYIEAVKEAVDLFVNNSISPAGSRYALIVFPTVADRDWATVTNFVDIATFASNLAGVWATGGGLEGSYDVLTYTFSSDSTLSWRPAATRIVILFGDEIGQSYMAPENTEGTTCASMRSGEVFAAVVPHIITRFYDECAEVFELVDDGAMMANNLSAIIQNPCN